MTILEQIRASDGEPSDDLMSARHAEMDALRPRLSCCARANRFTKLGHDGKWYPRAFKFEFFSDGLDTGEVFYCVACGTKLPAVCLKSVQSPTLCVVTDGGYRCDTCGERLEQCWCDPMESAYEVVATPRAPLSLNLNSSALFRLSECGREIWRAHCRELQAFLSARIPGYQPAHTGEETEVKLAIWAFIEIFGAPELWRMSGPNPLVDMNIEVDHE